MLVFSVDSNELITACNIDVVVSGSDGIVIRSPLTCYGMNVGSESVAKLGDTVDMLATWSISESGTQLNS
ncbi:MAG: hypothetical protein ACKESB_01550 [Candidatus Hodgkinia cicadicola]